MELLVISHTKHLRNDDGFIGWGPTVREINFLSGHFERVRHIAPVANADEVPASFDRVSDKVRLVATRNRGGQTISAKSKVLADSLIYFSIIIKEVASTSGLVHVRCPANISLIALLVLIFFPKKKKWIKYAGDWHPKRDHLSYKLQRFIARHLLRNATVTVNGFYPSEKDHIHHVLNPSFLATELSSAQIIRKPISKDSVTLLFVGSIVKNKRVDIAIDIVMSLREITEVSLFIVGDGPEKERLIEVVREKGLSDQVFFEGWRSKEELIRYYLNSDFLVLPSEGEGWPKVVSEAMSFGVIPIVSDVSGIRSILDSFRIGRSISSNKASDYSDAISAYLPHPDLWAAESATARKVSVEFTFEKWWENLRSLL